MSDRILEHGMHMWMGFYDNAFETIRGCYDEWRRGEEHPFQSWRDAFTTQRQITLAQRAPDVFGGAWANWTLRFPRLPGSPGEASRLPGYHLVRRVLTWLSAEVGTSTTTRFFPPEGEFAQRIAEAVGDRSPLSFSLCYSLLALQRSFRRYVEPLLRKFRSHGYFSCALADIALAATIGYLRDVSPHGEAGFDRINHLEFKDWLLSHGASPDYVWSAPVRSLYDLGFAYENGDSSSDHQAKAAAGVALKVLLLTVAGYKDAPLWKLNGGMGDVIFAPLYEVLRARGVSFKFFHRVADLRLSAATDGIQHIDFTRQAELGRQAYSPLIKVKGVDCWPSKPFWSQIVGSQYSTARATKLEWSQRRRATSRTSISVKEDFDLVVLAIPPAAWPSFARQLIAQSESMAATYRHLSWVPTRSAQVWLRSNSYALGWTGGATVATGYDKPYRSWGEMSHLIEWENWASNRPESCHYFCGTMTAREGSSYRRSIRTKNARLRREFLAWADASFQHTMPRAVGVDGRFDRHLIASEYYRANTDPSDMYVQSFPGSVSYRLRAEESGIPNLYLAGDWTTTRLNCGCVEAAFESGRRAAEAICRR